ncbi:MAG: transposase family protein [Desulfovibrio sp.]|jgi:hypothetical protein|nr:transposase family protein [Desulfovibrio sp.]
MAERLSIAIIEHFEDMPDPRQQVKVLYPLSETPIRPWMDHFCTPMNTHIAMGF